MTVKLQTERHLEFLSLTGGQAGLSESTLVKMPHCWKSRARAYKFIYTGILMQSAALHMFKGLDKQNLTLRNFVYLLVPQF